MAGYSGTPLPRKLGIKDGHRVWVVQQPTGFRETLGTLPSEASVATTAAGSDPVDVILLFVREARDLVARLPGCRARLADDGGLWICWPKKASGVRTDVTDSVVRAAGLATGLVDNKVCAVDDTWSGLRFVVRLADRGKGNVQAARVRSRAVPSGSRPRARDSRGPSSRA